MSMNSILSMRALALALIPCTAVAFAHADDAPKSEVSVSGFLDLYYQYDFGKSDSGVSLRQFDTQNNRYRLAQGYVDIVRAPSMKLPIGFTATIVAGSNADIIHGLEPAGLDSYRNIGQFFATYKTAGKVPLTVDLGKFWTPVGYEVDDNRANDEYSRGFNYYANQPLYHTGLRVTAPVSDKLTLAGYVVQGWNEVKDSNNEKSFILSASYAASSKLGLSLIGYQGKEGSTPVSTEGYNPGVSGIGYMGVTSDTTLVDAIATYQLSDKTKLAINADYLSSKGVGKSNGIALYGRHTLSDKTGVGVRFEHVEDLDGVRTGTPTIYHSLTATYDWTVASNLTLRFEAREDIANAAAFTSDSGLKKKRTTLTFAQIFKF